MNAREREVMVKRLREAAVEIASAGHAGWGNSCTFAADEIERLSALIAQDSSEGSERQLPAWHTNSDEAIRAAIFQACIVLTSQSEQEQRNAGDDARDALRWPPIDTAPKDGSWFLAMGRYHDHPKLARWDAAYNEFEDESGDHIYSPLDVWHPLPELPNFAAQQRQGERT